MEQQPAQSRLTATSWALLGMLSYQLELSGYDMRKSSGWGMRFFYGVPAHSQIYAELKKLEQLGLVTSRVEASGGTRNRRLYKITPAGLDAVGHWAVEAPVDPPALRHGLLMRVLFGHLTNVDKLRDALQEHVAYADDMRREAAKFAKWSAVEPAWAYSRLALQWAEGYYANESALAQQMLKDLDATQAEFAKATDGAKIHWPATDYWYQIEEKADAEDPE